ncbi:Beta-lactamase protein [Phytophthora nicotianae]|uniref:Beta-lactamase protein n=1 Tax=Phytophthora nicotianae TaxID=4792 RepID=A0A0W8DR44_PHYNI|nr:Beta-lactamase protein [Phytophthora nicotianae]
MLFTVKQVRVEPTTCNSDINIEKRRVFAVKLKEHQDAGNCIVYYDETNYNIYLKPLRGRSRKGERAVLSLPPSKGANLQIQCAVSSSIGLVTYQLEHGSIRMEKNAAFVEEIYKAVKASQEFRNFFQGKKVVIVLDNAPAHRQTEDRVTEHEDMELLRLGPYSPMCNPIEGCFSVLTANIKRHLAIYREEICDRSRQLDNNGNVMTLAGRQMRVLERAAKAEMKCMTSVLVSRMELHCSKAVNAAAEEIAMVYGK